MKKIWLFVLSMGLISCWLLLCGCDSADLYDFSSVRLPGGWGCVEMVKIPGGTFRRYGQDAKWHSAVAAKDYWLGKYEVTQGQFEAVMGYNPSVSRRGVNNPVTDVSWQEAKEFCKRLNGIYKGRLPQGCQFDLPTVAQWEYACCAGTDMQAQSKYYNDDPQGAGWSRSDSAEEVQPVGLKKPNAWGLYDMHGNVTELCRDLDKLVGYRFEYENKDAAEYVSVCGWGIFHDQYSLDKLSVSVQGKAEKQFYCGFRLALVPVENADVPEREDRDI